MNNEEIELKFGVKSDLSADAVVALADQNLSVYELQKFPRRSLINTYYDTSDLVLRKHGIGLRIRSDGEHFEQTVKSSSKVSGGLHYRKEYNIEISQDQTMPQPELFPKEFWDSEGVDLAGLTDQLHPLFTTNFNRTKRKIVKDGRVIAEFCFDSGKICSGDKNEYINEIELELIDGSVGELLQVARRLVDNDSLSLYLDARSKAQRGYELSALSSPPTSKSFLLLEGEENILIRDYLNMYLDHEQILLSRFDLRSLSVMTLAAYQLQKLTHDDRYNYVIPRLLELERMVSDSEGRHKKFMRMISDKSYLLFILDAYDKLYQ